MALESINPATGRLLRRYQPLSGDALRDRIALAHAACAPLRTTPIDHRALWLRKLASLLESDADELAHLVTTEMGKPLAAARAEALHCAAACRFFAANAARMLAPEPVTTTAAHSYLQWEPMGVILAILPSHLPLLQVIRFAAPALAAGNVCLLKPAPNVSGTALALETLARRAGFPRGSFQTLLLEAAQVESVLADPRVAAVTLAGSAAAGRAIAAQAGWLTKKSVLELAGSAPFLIRPSADLDLALKAAVAAHTRSSLTATRFLIATELYDTFVPRFARAMRDTLVGDPTLPQTEVGPLATLHQLEALEAQINLASRAGARVLTGGRRLPGPGFFFEPTVLADLPRSCPVYREEILGPVALVFRTDSLDDTIALANDAPAGPVASAWTRDPAEQGRLIAELAAGTVFLNQPLTSDHRGRELAAATMHDFMRSKAVIIAAPPTRKPPR